MAALLHDHHHSKIPPTPSRNKHTHPLHFSYLSHFTYHCYHLSLCVRVQNPSILEFSSISLLLSAFEFQRVYWANNGSFYRLWRLNGLAFVGASVRPRSRQQRSWISINFFLFFLNNWFGFCFLLLSFIFRFESLKSVWSKW